MLETKMSDVLLASTVSRCTKQGDSHGAVFVVDFDARSCRKVFDWAPSDIKWDGDGGERGLRGMAFHNGNILVGANRYVLVLDKQYREVGRITSSCLHLIHELCVGNGKLFITSTGFDAIAVYDLISDRFEKVGRFVKQDDALVVEVIEDGFDFLPPSREWHINSVFHDGLRLHVSTGLTGDVFILDEQLNVIDSPRHRVDLRLGKIGVRVDPRLLQQRVIYTHNVYPFRGGYVLNHTAGSKVVFWKDGEIKWMVPYPRLRDKMLNWDGYVVDLWTRGLCWSGDTIYAGAAPASVVAFKADMGEMLGGMSLDDDMRSGVHGLEVLPDEYRL